MRGSSLIDIVIALGIIALLFGGIYLVYFSLFNAISNIEARNAASAVLQRQVELIRNFPYANIGTQGGIPSGSLPAEQAVSYGSYNFTITTTVRNIDDPFDGVLGGVPDDTAPADYKLVQLAISCPACANFNPLNITMTVAPKGLESASNQGSLFINTFDALGAAVSGTTVRVVNANVSPAIDLTDTTNKNGVLQLVGVSTSTQSYQVSVSKPGYSSDKTYAIGGQQNPNPLKPHATVAEGILTTISFAIDRVSALAVYSSSQTCVPLGDNTVGITGSKLIGANPDTVKFSTSTLIGASGSSTLFNIEWDAYSLALSSSSYALGGTIPLSPLIVNPSSSLSFRFVLENKQPKSLLVSVVDSASGAGIQGASATLSGSGGFSRTLITGHGLLTDTDWSGGAFSSQAGMDTVSAPGSVTLLASASSTYSTSTTASLISNTIDIGSNSSTYFSFGWNPLSQPPETGVGSVKFQIAANNDNATWNFIGPDGTSGTYYAASSTASFFNNNRYVRYKMFMSTESAIATPRLDDATLEFYAACVPTAHVLFQNLSSGAYEVGASAAGYNEATTSVSVSSDWQSLQIQLVH